MRKRRLSGANLVEQRARGRCYRDFRGRGELVEICLEAVKDATDLVRQGRAAYFTDAAARVAEICEKSKDLDQRIACATGAGEVALKSKGATANLEGARMGHITAVENWKVRTALSNAELRCKAEKGKTRSACLFGVLSARSRLKDQGFGV